MAVSNVVDLTARLVADTSKFSAGMRQAEASVNKLKNTTAKGSSLMSFAFGGALTAVVYKLTDALAGAVTQATQLVDISQKIGVSAQAFEEISIAAGNSGVSMEQLKMAFIKLNLAMATSQGGDKAADNIRDAFARLNLTADQLKQLKPEEQLLLIGDRISKIKDISEQTDIASAIFKKGGPELLSAFNDDLRKTTQEIKDMGFVISDTGRKQLDDLTDKASLVGQEIKHAALNLLIDFEPALTTVGTAMAGFFKLAASMWTAEIAFIGKVLKKLDQLGTKYRQIFAGKTINEKLAEGDEATRIKTGQLTIRPDIVAANDQVNKQKFAKDEQIKQMEDQLKLATNNLVSGSVLAGQGSKKLKDVFDTSADALKRKTDDLSQSFQKLKTISDLLADRNSNKGQDVIENALDKSAPFANSAAFEQLLSDAFTRSQSDANNAERYIKDVIPLLERQMQFDSFGGANVSGEASAIQQLAQYLENSKINAANAQPQQVNVQVAATPDLTVQVTSSRAFDQAVANGVDHVFYKSAAGYQ
jgi:hypothetical protein